MAKFTYQLQAEALKFVLLYQFVQVNRQQFECNAHMIAKGKRIQHVNDVHCVILVLLPEVFQNADLLLSLTVETFLVSNHLQGNMHVRFMVVGFHHLPKGTFSDHLQHFVPISYVVVGYVYVRSLLVIVITVIRIACNGKYLEVCHKNQYGWNIQYWPIQCD